MTQVETYAYRNGVYYGVVVATPEQLKSMGLTDGDAPVIDPSEVIAQERSTMTCSPLQGILTLGESQWNKVLSYRDNYASWQEKVIIDSALDWRRNSQNIMFFQYLLEYTDTQVDDLFRAAAKVII